MTLSSLIDKAKSTTKKYWKWMLGVAIALVIALVWWKLRRQENEIIKLRAEVNKEKEFVKDLEARAKTASNSQIAESLREQAKKLTADIAVRETSLVQREKDIAAEKARIENARKWDELP